MKWLFLQINVIILMLLKIFIYWPNCQYSLYRAEFRWYFQYPRAIIDVISAIGYLFKERGSHVFYWHIRRGSGQKRNYGPKQHNLCFMRSVDSISHFQNIFLFPHLFYPDFSVERQIFRASGLLRYDLRARPRDRSAVCRWREPLHSA